VHILKIRASVAITITKHERALAVWLMNEFWRQKEKSFACAPLNPHYLILGTRCVNGGREPEWIKRHLIRSIERWQQSQTMLNKQNIRKARPIHHRILVSKRVLNIRTPCRYDNPTWLVFGTFMCITRRAKEIKLDTQVVAFPQMACLSYPKWLSNWWRALKIGADVVVDSTLWIHTWIGWKVRPNDLGNWR